MGIDLGTISAAGAAGAVNPMSALGGLALEGASAWYSNRMAEKRQHEAFDQAQMMYGKRYQTQVKDMMAAGLNPMLAVSQGAPAAGSVGQAQVQKPDLINAMANAQISSAQSRKINQETENLKVENNNLKNTSILLLEQSRKIGAEIDEIDQKVKVGKASEAEINRRTELLDIQKELVRVQALLGSQEYAIKHPEQVASGTQGAEVSATISRILKPLIDMLGGAARVVK